MNEVAAIGQKMAMASLMPRSTGYRRDEKGAGRVITSALQPVDIDAIVDVDRSKVCRLRLPHPRNDRNSKWVLICNWREPNRKIT